MDFASFYDAYWRTQGDMVDRQRLALLAQHVHAGEHVLQVDCGPGWLSEMMQGRGAHVVGTDLSAVAVERARARGVDARQHDIDSAPLPFEDGRFDVVVSDSQLEHRVDTGHALDEMVRVLRPGGRLILLLPNTAHWRVRLWLLRGRFPYVDHTPTDPLHLRFFTLPDIRGALERRGLAVERTDGSASLWVEELYPPCLRRGLGARLYTRLARRWPSLFARDFIVIARKSQGTVADAADAHAAPAASADENAHRTRAFRRFLPSRGQPAKASSPERRADAHAAPAATANEDLTQRRKGAKIDSFLGVLASLRETGVGVFGTAACAGGRP